MKKFLVTACLALAFCSCGNNSHKENEKNNDTEETSANIKAEIEQTVTNSIKKRLKNPESLKIESTYIKKDTLPYYFCERVISQAKETNEALDTYTHYKDMGYYWNDEKNASALLLELEKADLKSVIENEKALTKEDPIVAYVACVRSSGTNAMGGTVSSRSIYAIDTSNTSKILCAYDIDEDYIKNWYIIKFVEADGESPFTTDRFGNYDTSNMSFVEQFIMDALTL